MPKYPKIKSRKIKYNSPSGFAHIGKYIPPFENNDTGFGFKGVLIEDFESGKIQCSECGEWFDNLPTHLRSHKMTGKSYRIKFGLLNSTALKSKKMRLKQSKVMIELRKNNPQNNLRFKRGNAQAGNRKGTIRAVECKNKYGVCDLQIMEKVKCLAKELGKTPTLIDLKDRYGGGFIFHLEKRYNSYIKYCREIGMIPNFSSKNPKYSRKYFIEKAMSNEPNFRIFTITESRNLYTYFPAGIKELRKEILKYQ